MPQTARSNSSDKKYLAVGVGLCALDYICIIKKFSGPDEKHDAEIFSRQGGGPVPTALCVLGLFGEKTAFVGRCGDDPEGKIIKNDLERFGVDTKAMVFDSHCRSPRAFIWVDSKSGARSVVLDRTEISDLKPGELNGNVLQSCHYLLIDGRESAGSLAAAKMAKQGGAEVILDAGSPRKAIHKLLPFVDHLVVPKNFACKFTDKAEAKDASLSLLKMGFKSVVITLGPDGAVCATGNGFFHQGAFKVDVVDTTGAGDVFHGAFIYGLGKGWDIRKVVEFSCATAALKCKRIGGRLGIPKVDEVMNFLGRKG